jgi:hypothetical protein
MKKIFLVLALAAAGLGTVFADGFGITVSAITDAFFWRHLTGDYAEQLSNGTQYVYQGGDEIKAFQTSAFDSGMTGTIKFTYTDDYFGALLGISPRYIAKSWGTEVAANLYTGFLIDDFDWEAWLKVFGGHLKLLAGNQAQRGQIERYQHFDDFLKTKIDSLGVFYPIWQRVTLANTGAGNVVPSLSFPYGYETLGASKGFAAFASSETNDLFVPAGSTSQQALGFLVDAIFEPVTVSASVSGLFSQLELPFGSPWVSDEGTRLTGQDTTHEPLFNRNISGALRVEGAKLADLVSVAGVYKYTEADTTKDNAEAESMLLDEKVRCHAFGIYFNITPLAGLGITAGYSGLLPLWEAPVTQTHLDNQAAEDHRLSAYSDTIQPFYNGADLRASYSGIDDLRITFNNNVSFASVKGTADYHKKYSVGWAYETELNATKDDTNPGGEGRTENYLGIYNALGLAYQLSPALSLDLQIANQLGLFTLDFVTIDGEAGTLKSSTNVLGSYAGFSYVIPSQKTSAKATLHAGLACKWSAYQYQRLDNNYTIDQAGYLDFGIPLEVKVEF